MQPDDLLERCIPPLLFVEQVEHLSVGLLAASQGAAAVGAGCLCPCVHRDVFYSSCGERSNNPVSCVLATCVGTCVRDKELALVAWRLERRDLCVLLDSPLGPCHINQRICPSILPAAALTLAHLGCVLILPGSPGSVTRDLMN